MEIQFTITDLVDRLNEAQVNYERAYQELKEALEKASEELKRLGSENVN